MSRSKKMKIYGNHFNCVLTTEDIGAGAFIGEFKVSKRELAIINNGLKGFLEAQALLDEIALSGDR